MALIAATARVMNGYYVVTFVTEEAGVKTGRDTIPDM
jgi:hypothetical protein